MVYRFLLLGLWMLGCGYVHAQRSEKVSWTIGNESSVLDGGASKGPVTFTWTFNRPVQHGVYLDGTPWVVWEAGLQLVAVSPAAKKETLLDESGEPVPDAVVDATCINLAENQLPLDQRMGGTDGTGPPWGNGAAVWDGRPAALAVGDCVVTGHGRRNARGSFRHMIFNAIGVCNIVGKDMTGHYRPPIRMPRELRAKLVTPKEVKVASLPKLELSRPLDWKGEPVVLDWSGAARGGGGGNADDLMNGPMGNCGIYSHVWYEPANGTLNHHLDGKQDVGYQRNVALRFATCLYTAFDPDAKPDKRQRSLNKFIQGGLDYYWMHCLGYPIWNGGGGHPNGVEGIITLTGALLGDASITDAMKFQRFKGDAVGDPGKVYDMLSPSSNFARSEALYTLSPAPWKSGKFVQRERGQGATRLEDCTLRIDMAREDMVLNNRAVPYTAIEAVEGGSAITVGTDFAWPMFTRHRATEALRSYRFLPGSVLRLKGDPVIRKITDFRQSLETPWTEAIWKDANGTGGVIVVYPALTGQERDKIGSTGELTTGVCTRKEAEANAIVLWNSWSVENEAVAVASFFTTPVKDYLDIKLGDHFHWLPFYTVLPDPGAPGKKLHEESASFQQVKGYVRMQRDFGTIFWDKFASHVNLPSSPTIQALTRHVLLEDRMAEVPCKTYERDDAMWDE